MSVMFGPLFVARRVETAATDLIERWAESYLLGLKAEYPTVYDFDVAPVPKSYSTRNEFEIWPEDQLPGIVVVCSGTNERPKRRGDGIYSAQFALGVGVAVGSTDVLTTRTFAEGWGAIIRTLFTQKPSMERPDLGIRGLYWEGERYDSLPSDESRSVMATQVVFSLQINDVVQAGIGPDDPVDPSEYPPPPNTVTWSIEKEDIPS